MADQEPPVIRCAVYSRKSSDEGLEQAYNSLDAQRDACAAYIRSQHAEGWRIVETAYDDGGFSGGNIDRPGLKALLEDIKAGLVDVVVVYKIDRLTRALMDFARIVETLDASGASFVAVTQAFNTTTSMGRLTLNILLSFAQFEREITGERIRDKFASTRAKGIWVGSKPPLGYDRTDAGLVVVPAEAAVVRAVFKQYRKLKSIPGVVAHCHEHDLRSKDRPGRPGTPVTHASVCNILTNPIYIGKIRHRDQVLEGCHAQIVTPDEFEQAGKILAQHRKAMLAKRLAPPVHLLEGLLRSSRGEAFAGCRGKGCSYRRLAYTLPHAEGNWARRINAASLDGVVLDAVRSFTQALASASAPEVIDFLGRLSVGLRARSRQQVKDDLARIVEHVEINETAKTVTVRLRASGFDGALSKDTDVVAGIVQRITPTGSLVIVNGTEGTLDMPMVKALGRGMRWFSEILSGRSLTVADIARREGFSACYVSNTMELAFLAPDLKQQILEGRHPRELTAGILQAICPLPASWERQRELLAAARQMGPSPDRKALQALKGPMVRRSMPWLERKGSWTGFAPADA